MKKIFTILTMVMLMSVMLVAATPADVIKGETTPNLATGDGGQQAWLNHPEAGLVHCVLKPMVDKKGNSVEAPNDKWVDFWNVGVYWMKCNSFGPKLE